MRAHQRPTRLPRPGLGIHGGGQPDVVPLGHVKKRRGSYGAFQVNVQLDLRQHHGSIIAAPEPAGPAAPAKRRGRHKIAAASSSATKQTNSSPMRRISPQVASSQRAPGRSIESRAESAIRRPA